MGQYLARRVLVGVPTVIGATILVFLLLRVLPGDVAELILMGDEAQAYNVFTAEKIRKELGLDRSLPVQYLTWIGDIAKGDLGQSLWTGRPVAPEMLRRAAVTVQLALMAALIGTAIGIPIGIISAIKQDSPLDLVLRTWAIAFLAMPSFWLGLMVLLVGVRFFQWSPPVGYHTLWGDPKANLLQLAFPAAVLASHELARVARMTRSSMLEVLREDYIRTARAKGLAGRAIIYRHALKNALIPVITMTSLSLGFLMGGAVVMERVFTIPGLGNLFLDSLRQRDYTVVQAMVFYLSTTFVVINIIVDMLYGWLDPRISYSR